jgi:hypothetical protein
MLRLGETLKMIPVARVFAKSATVASTVVCFALAIMWIVSYGKSIRILRCTDDSQSCVLRQHHLSMLSERGLVEFSATGLLLCCSTEDEMRASRSELGCPAPGWQWISGKEKITASGPNQQWWNRLGFRQSGGIWRFNNGQTMLREVVVPYWALVGLFTILPGFRLYLACRHRPRPNTCSACGYDIRATPARCPECGTDLRPRVEAVDPIG